MGIRGGRMWREKLHHKNTGVKMKEHEVLGEQEEAHLDEVTWMVLKVGYQGPKPCTKQGHHQQVTKLRVSYRQPTPWDLTLEKDRQRNSAWLLTSIPELSSQVL